MHYESAIIALFVGTLQIFQYPDSSILSLGYVNGNNSHASDLIITSTLLILDKAIPVETVTPGVPHIFQLPIFITVCFNVTVI